MRLNPAAHTHNPEDSTYRPTLTFRRHPTRLITSLNFQQEPPITEAGLRNNITVGIHYLGSWLAGNGYTPIHNLMEDAATAEISRSQVYRSDEFCLTEPHHGHR